MEAVGHLLTAMAGGSQARPLGETRALAHVASEPQAVFGVFGAEMRNFDVDQYLANNADLSRHHGDIVTATAHFALHGWREGRQWQPPGTPGPDHLVIGTEALEDLVMESWKSGAYLAVALDDPVAIGRAMPANSSISRREAIKRVALNFSALHDRVRDHATALLTATDPSSLARQLAKLVEPLRISCAERWLEHYLRHRMVSGWQDAPSRASEPLPLEFADPDDAALAAALGGYAELLERRQVMTVTWPTGMFCRPDAPLRSPTGPIDLAGPARGILFGPHLFLPPGNWRCDATFTVSENRQGCRFAVDIYQRGAVNRTLSLYEFVLPEQGTYTLQLHIETRDPHAPIENRYVLHEGLIGGTFQLEGVKLVRC